MLGRLGVHVFFHVEPTHFHPKRCLGSMWEPKQNFGEFVNPFRFPFDRRPSGQGEEGYERDQEDKETD